MTWGVESNVIEQFGAAGVPKDKISFVRDTYTFRFASPPTKLVDAFRKYYGPTMNAFEAAEKNGRAEDLQKELDTLFQSRTSAERRDHVNFRHLSSRRRRAAIAPGLRRLIAEIVHWVKDC